MEPTLLPPRESLGGRVGTKNTSPRGSLCAVCESLKTHSSEMLWQSARVRVDLHVSTWGSFSDLSSWRISPVVEALIPTARRRQHLILRSTLALDMGESPQKPADRSLRQYQWVQMTQAAADELFESVSKEHAAQLRAIEYCYTSSSDAANITQEHDEGEYH